MKKKDPAFLFYSKWFYESTRTMFPIERACLIDLMIYQHQHGFIPDDIDRMTLYCTGVDKATLEATLEREFKRTENGWVNGMMTDVMSERKEYSERQAVSGRVGQFWKKSKAMLTAAEYKKLRDLFAGLSLDEVDEFISNKEIEKHTLKGWLKRGLSKALKDTDVIEDEDSDSIEEREIGGAGGKREPHDPEIDNILNALNELAGTFYRLDTKEHRKAISARLSDGATEQECLDVIALMCKQWKGTEMERHLTPQTLFRASNFPKYRDQVEAVKRGNKSILNNGTDRHAGLQDGVRQILKQKYGNNEPVN